MIWLLLVVLILAVAAYLTWVAFPGEDLRIYDTESGEVFGREEPCEEHDAVVAAIQLSRSEVTKLSPKQRLLAMRESMDQMSDGIEINADLIDVDINGLKGEWVIAPGVDCSRRVLYIHGGAFSMGSPKSHRNITNRFSEVANAAVLVIDYRLMPEHHRKASIKDCRKAYQWMLDNGPKVRAQPRKSLLQVTLPVAI